MQSHPLESPKHKEAGFALFNLGFRPFFLGAALFALISMTVWMTTFLLPFSLQLDSVTAMQWHAHEMIYGYGLAVIAGFLLTAVKNWTGIQTLHGKPLCGLFCIWLTARLLLLGGTTYILPAALADLLFGLLLMGAVAMPIIKARQWKQMAVLSKLVIIVGGNSLFYLGALGYLENGIFLSLYGGLYITISLILVVGRRVIPFFIERGVEEKITLRQYRWMDISILVFFLLFFVNELFVKQANITVISAAALFLLNGSRLYNWHTPGIWKSPLLWGLYVSSWLINAGFLLIALEMWFEIPRVLAIHLFTIGGIGLMTMAMMARVALGHTGRNIRQPSRLVSYALFALVLSAGFRVGMPLISMDYYIWWLTASYLCWVIAFVLFIITYMPILLKPRPDGQSG